MSRNGGTRATIVDEALRQASIVGLEGLSLGPLAEALQMSKSGLFAHFKSREALQLAVLEAAIERFEGSVLEPALAKSPGAAELTALFKAWLRWIQGPEDFGGCVFMTMAQEYDARSGPIRDRLVDFQTALRKRLEDTIRRGISGGVFRADADPGQTAFELQGFALSFQQATHLMGDRRARRRALGGLQRLIEALAP